MSGPLHAIMRGQYTQSYQSADERARNRAAAAAVLGVALIGGAIFVGKEPFMKYLKGREVTAKHQEEIAKLTNTVRELESQATEGALTQKAAAEEATKLAGQIKTLEDEARTRAAEIVALTEKADALEAEKKRMEQDKGILDNALDSAKIEAQRSSEHSEELLAELETARSSLLEATKDAQRAAAAHSENAHNEKKVAILHAEVDRLKALLHAQRDSSRAELEVQRQIANDALAASRESGANAEASARELEEERAKLAHMKANYDTLKDSLSHITKELDGVRRKNTGLTQSVSEAKESQRAAVANLETKISELRQKDELLNKERETTTELRKEKEAAQVRVHALLVSEQQGNDREVQITAQRNRLQQILDSVTDRQEQLANLTVEVESKGNQIAHLRQTNESLSQENAALKAFELKVALLEQQNSGLQRQLDELQNEAGKTQTTIGEIKAETTILKADQAALEKLRIKFKELGDKLAASESKLASAAVDTEVSNTIANLANSVAGELTDLVGKQQMDLVQMAANMEAMMTNFATRLAKSYDAIATGYQELARAKVRNATLDERNMDLVNENTRLKENESNAGKLLEEKVKEAKEEEQGRSNKTQEALETRIRGLEDELANARKTKDEMQANHAKDIGDLNKTVGENEMAKADLEKRVEELKTDVATWEGKWNVAATTAVNNATANSAYEERITSLTAEAARLAAALADATNTKTELQAKVSGLEKQIKGTSEAYSQMKGYADSQRKTSENETAKSGELARQLHTANGQLFAAANQISKLEVALAGAQADAASARDGLAASRIELDVANDQKNENAGNFRGAWDPFMTYILLLLKDPSILGDGSSAKGSFQKVMASMIASGIYTQETYQAAMKTVNDSIYHAVLAQQGRQKEAEEGYAKSLQGLQAALEQAQGHTSQVEQQNVQAQADLGVAVQKAQEDQARITQLEQARVHVQAELENVKEQLVQAEATIASHTDQTDLVRTAYEMKHNFERSKAKMDHDLAARIDELAQSVGEKAVREEINAIATTNGTTAIDEDGNVYFAYAISPNESLPEFMAARFQSVDLRLQLHTRLGARKMTNMADRFIRVVSALCGDLVVTNDPPPAFTCDVRGMDAVSTWATQVMGTWATQVMEVPKESVVAKDHGSEKGIKKRRLVKKKAKPPSDEAKLKSEALVSRDTDNMGAFGALPSQTEWRPYALGAFMQAQRVALACILTAARAEAISRAARAVTPSSKLLPFASRIALPKAVSAGYGKPPRKRAFV